MDKFIKRCLFFLTPLLALAIPLDYFISSGLKKCKDYPGEFEVMNDIYNGTASCDIAVYGSSRAWVHFNPLIMEKFLGKKVYNFGIDGHNFRLQYLRHLEFLKYNKKPEKIIICLDMFGLQKRTELYQIEQFLPYMLWNNNIENYTSNYNGFKTMDYKVPLLRYAGRTKTLQLAFKNLIISSHSGTNYRYKGYRGMNKTWNSDFENAKNQRKKFEFSIDGEILQLFEQFISECVSSNIILTLVYAPEYIEAQQLTLNRNGIINVYKSLAEKYSLQFIDFSDNEICSKRELFYNASHLNKTGSDLFTNLLVQEIRKP
jgi:hypothetical protein